MGLWESQWRRQYLFSWTIIIPQDRAPAPGPWGHIEHPLPCWESISIRGTLRDGCPILPFSNLAGTLARRWTGHSPPVAPQKVLHPKTPPSWAQVQQCQSGAPSLTRGSEPVHHCRGRASYGGQISFAFKACTRHHAKWDQPVSKGQALWFQIIWDAWSVTIIETGSRRVDARS